MQRKPQGHDQPQPQSHPHDDKSDLAELVQAASICGCLACRRIVRASLVKRRAEDAFQHAFADLTAAIGLPWVIRKNVA